MIWPVLTGIEPQAAAAGGRVTVFGEGGYLFTPPGKYDESSRTFDVFFGGEAAGSINCYVHRCEGEFTVPDGVEPGEYPVTAEGGSRLIIQVNRNLQD